MNEVIELAIKGGYGFPKIRGWNPYPDFTAFMVQDPTFWQALGKGLGNKDVMECDSPKCDSKLCEYAGYKDPKRMYDQYHELLWYGGNTEKFWKDLIKPL